MGLLPHIEDTLDSDVDSGGKVMLRPVNLMYGTDPEGFFKRGGHVIGSERVLPETGLISPYHGVPFVVNDGVQFELNPDAAASPAVVGSNLSVAFQLLRDQLKQSPDVTVSFDRIAEVSRMELDALSEKARELGCMPSMNIYGERPLRCNKKTYRKRSLGGHIHLGLTQTNVFRGTADQRQRLIPLLDIFVGNFCVLLDRDPGAAERRENYGRAGEFRLPGHGVEYRTPDNFWLQSYTLLSFVLGMCNLATSVLVHTLTGGSQENELVSIVNINRVRKAIEKNDIRLAKRNIEDLRPWLAENLPDSGFPIRPGTIGKLLELGSHIDHRGIESVFPDDVLTHWAKADRTEFNTFLEGL